jgi:pyridoxine 4-dehydrogenase
MRIQTDLGGSFTLPGTAMTVNRMGYGAMQLAGPQVFGPPRDVDAAVAVLREAVTSGVNHIDTSDFYGPHRTNQIIKQALHPYPDGLVIVTKVGARRGADKSWVHALAGRELIEAVQDNLRNGCRQPACRRSDGASVSIHRGAADRTGGTQESRTDSSSRPEQRQSQAIG